MIEPVGIYHIGIPVDDIDRAEGFYTKILGMKVADRIGEAGARLGGRGHGGGRYHAGHY